MKNVIITGANGFIGYALVQRLNRLGVSVYAVVREGDANIQRLRQMDDVRVVECSLEHMCSLPERIPDQAYDTFYHLAWQGVSGSESCDLSIQFENVRYSCEAVRAAGALGVGRFIFAASIMEYEVMKLMGTVQHAGMRNAYRAAKLAAHYFTRIEANDIGIVYHAAIISNVFGEGEVSPRFINSTIRRMLRGERVAFTKAVQKYDFIYIEDAVDMLCLAGEAGLPNQNYYIGSMKPRMLREYICEMRDCIDGTLELGFGENSDFVGICLDYDEFDLSACRRDFGYEPKHTFREGILKTVEWMKETGQDEEAKGG